MALREIDPDPTRQLATDFGRRGPWAAHFARSGNNNTTTKGTDGGLTRRWAHGPAKYDFIIVIIIIPTAPRFAPHQPSRRHRSRGVMSSLGYLLS